MRTATFWSSCDCTPANAGQRRPRGFERGQCRLLIVEAQRLWPLLPGVAPCGQQMVVQPAALLKLLFEETLLPLVRVQAVCECLTHVPTVIVKRACCQAVGAMHPRLTPRAFWPHFCKGDRRATAFQPV